MRGGESALLANLVLGLVSCEKSGLASQPPAFYVSSADETRCL